MTQAFAQTLSADTIPQTGAEEEIGQMYRGTYSPDDIKLRLYASLRLDEETLKKCMMRVPVGAETGTVCGASLDTGPRGCVTVSRR
jgi:hypothetical protein